MSRADSRKQASSRGAARHQQSVAKPSIVQRLQRWLMQAVVTAGILVVLAGAVRGGWYLLELNVERIAISGAIEHVSADDIQALTAPQLARGFLAADLDGIREQLEALPWVYHANVRRRWPETVEIQIEEQRPIARWGMSGFLNHEGDYFPGEQGARWQALPRLDGPEGSEAAMMRRYQNLEALLTDTGLQVVWLAEDDIGQVSAELDNGVLLALGTDHFVQRVRRFVTLQQQHLNGQAVVRVDLRYEHGAAVQLLEPQIALNATTQEEFQ